MLSGWRCQRAAYLNQLWSFCSRKIRFCFPAFILIRIKDIVSQVEVKCRYDDQMISVLDKWNDVQQARDCNNKKRS